MRQSIHFRIKIVLLFRHFDVKIQRFPSFKYYLMISYIRTKILYVVFLHLFLYYYENFIFFLFTLILSSSLINFLLDQIDAHLLYTIRYTIYLFLYVKKLDVLLQSIKKILLLLFTASPNSVLLSYEYLISLLRVPFIIDAG